MKKEPNAETLQALKDSRNGENLIECKSVDELFEQCGLGNKKASELIIIKGSLASLNDYIDKQRINKYAGAKCKKDNTNFVAWKLPNIKIDYKIDIDFLWFCKDKRQDKDNICFAKKFILDAMIKKGIIPNDGWKEIGNFKDNFYVDKQNPRIELRINQSKEE